MQNQTTPKTTISTLIFPRYKQGTAYKKPPEEQTDIVITRREMARIVMGEHFTLACGKEVNKTYQNWVKNIAVIQTSGYISEYLAEGFLELNYYRRSETEGTKQDDVPDFYYPPYVI